MDDTKLPSPSNLNIVLDNHHQEEESRSTMDDNEFPPPSKTVLNLSGNETPSSLNSIWKGWACYWWCIYLAQSRISADQRRETEFRVRRAEVYAFANFLMTDTEDAVLDFVELQYQGTRFEDLSMNSGGTRFPSELKDLLRDLLQYALRKLAKAAAPRSIGSENRQTPPAASLQKRQRSVSFSSTNPESETQP
jgi:hypothetical protein